MSRRNSAQMKKLKTSCDVGLDNFKEFCENTSIHGLKYITEDGSDWVKRILWILVFLAGVAFSSYFCVQMWKKWDESPVLMSLDTNRYPLKNIHFPAVTICNVNKVSRKRLQDVLAEDPKYANVTFELMQRTLRYMTKLDRAINSLADLQNLTRTFHSQKITPIDLFDILRRTSPACDEIVIDCTWLGRPEPCLEFFSFLPTDDGICCTFNGANYKDPELGIDSGSHEPLNVSGNGYRMGLALVLNANISDYSVTNGKFDGFKVLVHSSEEFPDVADRGFVIGPGSETFVGIKGITTFSTEEVALEVPPNKRQCQVEGEKVLKYFPRYSRSACAVECATKMMQEECKCRPYFFRADKETPLCNLSSYGCLSDIYESVREKEEELCYCRPPCTDVWFEPEISNAPFPGRGFNLTRTFKRMVKDLRLGDDVDTTDYFKSNVAVLHVYYKEKTGVRYKTDIRFGVEDFISAMGGLLGLGLGLSFISVIEIFYFLCLHCFFQRKTRSRQNSHTNRFEIQQPNSLAAGPDKSDNSWPSSATITTSIGE